LEFIICDKKKRVRISTLSIEVEILNFLETPKGRFDPLGSFAKIKQSCVITLFFAMDE